MLICDDERPHFSIYVNYSTFKKWKTFFVFLSSYGNMRGNLGEMKNWSVGVRAEGEYFHAISNFFRTSNKTTPKMFLSKKIRLFNWINRKNSDTFLLEWSFYSQLIFYDFSLLSETSGKLRVSFELWKHGFWDLSTSQRSSNRLFYKDMRLFFSI